MTNETKLKRVDQIELLIHEIRGQKVIMDSDSAALYGVSTKVLNQAVRRKIDRFPADFLFQLTSEEIAGMRSQFVTASKRKVGGHDLTRVFGYDADAKLINNDSCPLEFLHGEGVGFDPELRHQVPPRLQRGGGRITWQTTPKFNRPTKSNAFCAWPIRAN